MTEPQFTESHTPGTEYLAGGTTMVDLMKLGVATPTALQSVPADDPKMREISVDEGALKIGSLVTMAELAAHPALNARWAVLREALILAASPQIRNMATLGGNLLQRTRCSYFRDIHSACNKRLHGSGCSAIGGITRDLAILGTSDHCIANYPGDFACALVATDAILRIRDLDGATRTMPAEDLHHEPGTTPHIETSLAPGDIITEIEVPDTAWTASVYTKVRDRKSYAFALVSCATSIRLEDSKIAEVRVVLGGVATRPWRCAKVEAALLGQDVRDADLPSVARYATEGAVIDDQRQFKIALTERTVLKSLREAVSRAV